MSAFFIVDESGRQWPAEDYFRHQAEYTPEGIKRSALPPSDPDRWSAA